MIRVPAGHQKEAAKRLLLFGAPAGTRTPDTLLKRQVLYLLSYWGGSSEQASDRLAHGKEYRVSQIGAQRSGSDLERKKEAADMELSRQALIVARFSRVAMLLRKPGRRNGAAFF